MKKAAKALVNAPGKSTKPAAKAEKAATEKPEPAKRPRGK